MKRKRYISCFLSLLLLLTLLPQPAARAYSAEQAVLTFSDSAVTPTVPGSGYSVSGTALSINAAGTYRITGSCSEGSITVSKGLSGVTLILDSLTLRSSVTAPLAIKKSCGVLLKLEGESTLTDDEDASTEATNADFEGAALKVKSGSSLTIFGSGTLNAVGSAKNGVKGAAESSLTVDGGTINANAVNNAVAFDGSVTVNAGTLRLTSENDGLKAAPDEGDTASAGTVTIHGGTFTIRARGDAIQAGTDLTITGGDFDIQTLDGYQSRSFNADTMSCKGLKASGNDAETENADNRITISGGDFRLNTADDAIHSDGDVTVTGGTFDIYTGDDGLHADTTLTLGAENGLERDPEITIRSSYEGLEGGTINAYSGKYYVVASDDGVNSAGGSSNGTDPGGGGGNHFNPGRPGGGPGGPGGGMGGGGNYSLNFYGGSFFVDCRGDGLDANGSINLYGGSYTVMSMASGGDNSPLDADGSILIQGATVFGAGSSGMAGRPASGSQNYYLDSTRRSAGTVVNISHGGSLVYSEKLLRNINYLLYSSPDMTSSSCAVSTAASVSPCASNAWAHSWDGGAVETAATEDRPGARVYTCAACGAVERKTVPQVLAVTQYEAEGGPEPEEPAVYTAAFALDPHAAVDVYYAQNYAAPDETAVSTAVARNAATGEIDGTGDGQINFAIRVEAGYELDAVTVEGAYKNLKDLSETEGIANLYRVTKIAGDLTVTVTTKQSVHSHTAGAPVIENETAPTCTQDGSYDEAVYCAVCGAELTRETVAIPATGHNWGEWTVVKPATEAEEGLARRVCANDASHVETKPIEKLTHVHTLEKTEAVPPTCTEDGAAAYWVCAGCGRRFADALGVEEIDAPAAIPAAGHTPGESVRENEKAAACTGDGSYDEAVYCAVCGAELTRNTVTVPATGHNWGEWTVMKPATVLAEGLAQRVCANDPAHTETTPIEQLRLPFLDVPIGSWYTDAVAWAVDRGVTTGTSDTAFSPDAVCTRAQVVTFLWRMAGRPAPEGENPFADVVPSSWYAQAVTWAVEQGITVGTSESTFSPDALCTRAQIVTLLWRAGGCRAPEGTAARFTDVDPASWYSGAVAWAVGQGVTTGTSERTFSPDAPCTRAQVVTFLYRSAVV